MKQVTLRFENADGEVIDEKTIKVSENDKLIFRPKNSHIPTATLHQMFKKMSEVLESDVKLLYIPEWLELEVLKVK